MKMSLSQGCLGLILFVLPTAMFAILGNYQGKLQPRDGAPIDLQVFLALSPETVSDQEDYLFDRKHRLEASFVVDQESGPFEMDEVQFFLTLSKLKMIYRRENSPNTQTASNFILEGQIDREGVYRGQYLRDGKVGEFVLHPTEAEMTVRPKYAGLWRGEAFFEGSQKKRIIEFSLEDAGGQTINPPHYSFKYTPTKLAMLVVEQIPTAFNKVYIDYFSRKIIGLIENSATNGGDVTFSGQFDAETMRLTGTQFSNLQGKVMTFDLEKVE